MDARTGFTETHPLPARERVSVVRPLGFDDGAALVAGRSDKLLQQGFCDAVDVVLRVDDEEVDRADVAAGSNGGPKRKDRASDDDALRFSDDDAGLRQIDQLAHEIGRSKRALAAVSLDRTVAKRDDSIDVRDTGCSDQVFHADGYYLAGFGDRRPSIGFERGDSGARDPLVVEKRWTLTRHVEGAADRYCIKVAVR